MRFYMHEHYFGESTVSSTLVACPCGHIDFLDKPIDSCEFMEEFVCAACGGSVFINWGLTSPDHLSIFQFTSFCPNHLCQAKGSNASA